MDTLCRVPMIRQQKLETRSLAILSSLYEYLLALVDVSFILRSLKCFSPSILNSKSLSDIGNVVTRII